MIVAYALTSKPLSHVLCINLFSLTVQEEELLQEVQEALLDCTPV